jgi:hypothetical protein
MIIYKIVIKIRMKQIGTTKQSHGLEAMVYV